MMVTPQARALQVTRSDAVAQPNFKAGCLLCWKVHMEIDNEVGPW